MTAELKASIVLITSSDPKNSRFGTGFVIRQASGTAYILTCDHVLRDVGGPETVLVEGQSVNVVVSGESCGVDLAVLQVDLDKPPLPWQQGGEKGQVVLTSGFQLFSKDHLLRPLQGKLGDSGELQAGTLGDRVQVWDLLITDDYTLQPGYSGSPLMDEKGEKVIGVVSHRQGEGKSGLAISIAALDKLWRSVDGKQLFSDLLGLGYRQQERLFRKFLEAIAGTGVGAFWVCGPSQDYGQRWLVNRLAHRFIPNGLTTGKIVRVELGRLGRRNDVSALWRELGGRVGLGGKLATPSEIADRVCRWWKTQNVILVLHDVDYVSEEVLEELVQNFWLPLSQKARSQVASDHPFRLLFFLIDYGEQTGDVGIQFVAKLDESWDRQMPVRSPQITEFSDIELTDWIEDSFSRLPSILTQNVDRTVLDILDNTENGIPLLTLQEICYRCECDWYEEMEPCLKL